MNEYTVYKYMEFIIFSIYLIFIYLLVQIWFLWKDIEKTDLFLRSLAKESFFRKNCLYIFLFSSFFIIHEFFEGLNFEGIKIPNSMVFFEFLEMMAIVTLLLFAYNWYIALKPFAKKKSLLK
jgi:hypothetical protein